MKQWEEQTGYELLVQHDELKSVSYPITVESVRRRRRRRKKRTLIMSAMSFGIIAALSFQAVNFISENLMLVNRRGDSQIARLVNADSRIELQQSVSEGNLVDVVREAMPTVASITGVSIQEIPNWYGRGIRQYEGQSRGSGI